ncbi:RIMS-binding protein 3C-like [Eublepharis macularius]|uniref:RIMS-binding protein 3C-like n=1 Tax=Eublepharis macularius TaxID=481883 RepID=A0AA97LH39_EUBMA|nr:RIMS-binding protein 3C-like [Eublepharis macularius]
MTKDSPSSSGGGGGPPSPRAPRPSLRRAPCQHPGGGSTASCGASPSLFHEDHRRELEALRAELEAERLRSQEARRRFAVEARELREAAERDRQLLADQLRSKWEQQRARELHQLREATQRQREAEIRQLLRWKEAELREAQELLQRERDAAMRQARDLQRQLAEELVSRGGAGGRGASGGGLSTECRAKLQEVLGKLRWEVDGEQAARIRHLKAELELERSLFLKYILQRFEGESLRAGSPHRFRQASSQQRLGRTRPRSLESLIAACTPDVQAVSNQSSSPARGESPCCPQVLEEGKPADSSCPEQPHQKVVGKESPLKEESKQEGCADAPPEGKVSCWGAAGERTPEAMQGQGWLSGHSYDQLMKQNTELLDVLANLEQRCTHLKEENALLRRSSFPEMQDKVKRLKGKNAELAVIAKRLEERAKKLQETHLRVSSTPIPLALNCSEMELCKDMFAQQQAKDLNKEALLAKDQQLETLQKECQELQAKLSAGKENTYLLDISDFDRLLRESQREVLRLQRQITLKTLKESLQTSKVGSNGSSSSVSKQEASSAINVHLEDSSLVKKTPKTLNILKKDAESENHLQLLQKQLVEKLKQYKSLKHEVEEKQKRWDELQLKLKKILSENVRLSEENFRLHEKNKWAEKIDNENADLKMKLIEATDKRNSAVQLTKGLEVKVENLKQVIKNMEEIAERQQQLETEHEKTLLEPLKKEEKIRQLQQVQTEIRRKLKVAVQLHEAQMKELENQYHSQTEHFNLQSQDLELLQIKKAVLLGSELSHTTCSSTGMSCPEQDTYHALHCSNNISDEDCVSMASVDLIQKVKELESCSNSSGSESMQNSSKSCLNPEEDTLGEMEELETDKIFLNLQSENQDSLKLRVFLARYSYDPFNGPNKNPEAELPLTAGEYVYIYGEMDEDGFYKGELMDGRRGIVPSNLVEEVPGNDLISFIPSEPSEISYNSFHESSFPCQSASSGEKSNSPDEDTCSHLLSNRPEGELYEVQAAVPYPKNLTLIKQSARSIIIGWDPPQILDNWGEIQSYNIYVNSELRQNVNCGSQMKTVIENLDLKLQTYRISVQSVTDKGNSDRMQCTFLVGNTFHIAPTVLNLHKVTATSAKITWLPSNSNYIHTVYLNEKEYDVTKAGIYCYSFQNLKPSTQYSVKVESLNEELVYTQGGLEQKSTAITFTTPSAGPPDTPLDVQVQLGSSADVLVISWLPVTIDAAGSSNGVKVIGYAIYINGQKVTKIMSPTAGSISLEVSQIHMFQGPWKVSVRTVSLFGESEDSVPALIPLTLLKVPSALLSKFVASELTFKEFLESEGMPVSATTYIEEEEEEDQETKWAISGEDVCKPQENPESSLELPKDKIMTLRADQTMTRSASDAGPQRSIASGDSVSDDPARLFVALFDSDPTTMSPNFDKNKEQLLFKDGQVLKVIGDKDAIYRGECEGKKRFIPCNMVSEMHIDSSEVKNHLLKKADEE